ncbi:MAG: ATP-binding protein [Candidatus Nitrosotenuis sp.]
MIESERLLTISQIASRTELRVNNAISILKILSKNPNITNPPSATLIDEKLHGISEDADTDRRNAMRIVFDEYGGYQNMLFLLPNGNVYINEPFFFQRNLTVSNFAFMDWYKEVVKTQDVVVSEVVVSKSSGKPNIVIAVPVFSQDGSLQGILTGSLNLDKIQERLVELKSYTDERIFIVDDTSTVIADSEKILKGQSLALGIETMKNSPVGKTGTVVGTINGTKMFVAHSPIKVGSNTWSIISIQPYDQAFSDVNKTIDASLILITLIVVVASVSIFTVNRLFQTQFKLRKQAEENNASLAKTQALLLKSEEKYRNLYRLSPDAIVVFDNNGIVISYNEGFTDLFGHSSQELLGKSIFGIVSDDRLDLAHSYFDELRKTGILVNKENWLKKKDGIVFPSLFSVSTMTDHNNSIVGYIAIIKDISEIHNTRKKLEEASNTIQDQLVKLKEVDKLKEEFGAMITHELKTPLVPIIGYCKMLKNEILGTVNKEQVDAIDTIDRNAKRLESLISDIMDARKLDIGKMKFDIEKVELDEFFDSINSSYKTILAQSGKEFVTTILEKGLAINTDKTRLRQALDNLISNAIKFTPEKNARIEVGLKKDDTHIVFYVKDNGIGIPPDKQQHLFVKFYQIDTSERRKVGGTGLGLVIAKDIVEKLNGTISVESDGVSGSTFFIKFPISVIYA